MALRSFKKDWALKLVSIGLALGLFAYVQSLDALKDTRVISVPILTTNVRDGLVVTSRQPESLTVTIRGPIEEIERLDLKSIKARALVDLSQADPERGAQDFNASLDRPAELQGFELDFDPRVTVVTEALERVTRPISVETAGSPGDGLEFSSATVEPESVTLTGVASALAQVANVRVLIDLADVRPGESTQARVEVFDRMNRLMPNVRVSPDMVSVSPALNPLAPRRNLLVTPRWTGQPEFGYRVTDITVRPIQVNVQGDRQVLAGLSIIETDPISLDGLRIGFTRTVGVRVPQGLRVIGPRRVTVSVRVEPVPTGPLPTAPPTQGPRINGP